MTITIKADKVSYGLILDVMTKELLNHHELRIVSIEHPEFKSAVEQALNTKLETSKHLDTGNNYTLIRKSDNSLRISVMAGSTKAKFEFIEEKEKISVIGSLRGKNKFQKMLSKLKHVETPKEAFNLIYDLCEGDEFACKFKHKGMRIEVDSEAADGVMKFELKIDDLENRDTIIDLKLRVTAKNCDVAYETVTSLIRRYG